ncbi:hypothetical protein QPK87_19685 [Kamptonema cortianum]|nr:hypothetical protein [Geitlerinema splendidum]MDK3158779.1 hypothetical protein [Kamptonema cortianum]
MARKKKLSRKKGAAMIVTFGVMTIVAIAATAYIDRSTMAVRNANHNLKEVQVTNLCDAGVQAVLRDLWRPFKTSQHFVDLDTALGMASHASPKAALTSEVSGVGRYAAGVVSYTTPNGDNYARMIVIRSVGWIDRNNNGLADSNEPRKTVDVTAEFRLARSKVFDYTYFINNFGWMQGFSATNLIVNGDMRSNGDFTFLSGSGTINGSVIASMNEKLVPGAPGMINAAPWKQTQTAYTNSVNNVATPHRSRMRQPYNPAIHGAPGTPEFEKWRDLVFQSDATVDAGRIFGAALEDARGSRAWQNPSGTVTETMIDPRPTEEVVMPDLRDFGGVADAPDINGKRFARSKAYVNDKPTFGDGTPNPNYSGNPASQSEFLPDGSPNVNYKGAYVDVWDQTLNGGLGAYRRVSSNGVVNASVLLVGTAVRPIRIHGPVAVNGDVAIAGTIQGQGTLYSKRNVHVIGSVRYANPPNFLGTNMQAIENAVEKADFLGLAASESVIMGNTNTFSNPYPLRYMTPPFTKPRLDENGNLIPAFNANEIDSYGVRKYQSLLQFGSTAAAYAAVAAGGVNQIDAVLYSNFVGGGNVGTAGGGMTLNGTIISRDEAIVAWSVPIRLNYDHRIRERDANQKPLIDLDLPRSPTILRSTWQDLGFRVR